MSSAKPMLLRYAQQRPVAYILYLPLRGNYVFHKLMQYISYFEANNSGGVGD